MDYHKINSHIILLLIVGIVSFGIATFIRWLSLDAEVEAGTAERIFWLVFAICIIAYLIIMATLAHIIVPWIMKKLSNKKKFAPTITENSTLNKKEELIANERTTATQTTFAEDIRIFEKYVDIEMNNSLGANELSLLKGYINDLITSAPPTSSIVIQPRELKNDDIKNFIGNITRFFNYPQAKIASWAIAVFGNLGMDNPEKDLPARLSNKKTAKIIRVLQKKEMIELVQNTLKDDKSLK